MRTRNAGRRALIAAALALTLLVPGALRPGWGADPVLERVSISSGDMEGNQASVSAAVSADGRFVTFASDASNLVAVDTNARDIFVRDRLSGTTELVNIASDGTQANRSALSPAISGDGRYVVFQSDADNLVPNDTNDASDVFIHDLQTGTTDRVSVASDGTQGNDDSITPSISGDGRYVTFTSLASNLVEGDTNNDWDVFVHDRQSGVTERASVASDGTQGNFSSGWLGAGRPQISGDGRYVVFGSFASNLVPDDTNDRDDIFLRDRLTGSTERVSVASDGAEGNDHSMYPSVSDDGRYVVFASAADNLTPEDNNGVIDVLLRDRQAGTTIRLSDASGGGQGDGPSRFPAISGDGGLVAYQSAASNLVPDDNNGVTDIFLYHRESGELKRVSAAGDGSEADGASSFVAISADGDVIAFQSNATNLVPNDTNGVTDIFAWGKPLSPPATPTPTTPAGDVNCDDIVNSIDAALVLQFGAGLIDTLPCFDAADVNGDDSIDAIDAALILQFDAGLIDSLD